MEYLKKIVDWTRTQLKNFWNWLLGKTTIDEKIEDVKGKKRRGRPKK